MLKRSSEFEEFVATARPRLLRALAGCRGVDAPDAVAEALAFAWERWEEVRIMENPVGYLYRVGQSRTRPRRTPVLPAPEDLAVPDIEPLLIPAFRALPDTQRTAVWLVHACGWPYAEVAAALDTSVSMVGNHVTRGLDRLRRELKVGIDG